MNRLSGDQRDRAAQYAVIGQFVVEFEWICWLLRFHACSLLQIHGLTKWPLGQVILQQRVSTGEPLFACCASMVAECFGFEHPLVQELGALSRDFHALCKIRNYLLHAFYLTGNEARAISWRDAPPDVPVGGRTSGKRGAQAQIGGGSVRELQRYVAAATIVRQKIKEFVPRVAVALAADSPAAAHR